MSVSGLALPNSRSSAALGVGQPPHICVCTCTYKRPEMLRRLLETLERQQTDDVFSFSIVVADNDATRSAENVVSAFASRSMLRVVYCCEPTQNIALVRNRELANSSGDYIALLDDDEFPTDRWLRSL